MSSEKSSSPTTETKIDDGSPKKGIRLVLEWALWIVQSSIAYFFAAYVWGDLVKSPSVFDISLSFLSIAALYGIVKSGVTVFFKRVNYLYLYVAFLIGLWLYKWSLNLILPTEWIAYWWLPYLFIAPLILELPIINLGITEFIPWKLYSNLMWIAVATVFPYIIVYAVIFAILHPLKTISYLRKNFTFSAVLRITVGIAACSIAVKTIYNDLSFSVALLYGILTYFVIIVVVIAMLGFFMLLNARKIDFSKQIGLKRLFHAIQIIIFPLWIITNASVVPNNDTANQTKINRSWDYILTVPVASLSIGVLTIAFLLQFVQPITVLLIYWIVNFFGASAELILTAKPKFQETKIYKIFNFFIIILILPFFLFSGIAAAIEQAQNQPPQVQQEAVGETVSKDKISEQKAG